jgi:hypothetical protein
LQVSWCALKIIQSFVDSMKVLISSAAEVRPMAAGWPLFTRLRKKSAHARHRSWCEVNGCGVLVVPPITGQRPATRLGASPRDAQAYPRASSARELARNPCS